MLCIDRPNVERCLSARPWSALELPPSPTHSADAWPVQHGPAPATTCSQHMSTCGRAMLQMTAGCSEGPHLQLGGSSHWLPAGWGCLWRSTLRPTLWLVATSSRPWWMTCPCRLLPAKVGLPGLGLHAFNESAAPARAAAKLGIQPLIGVPQLTLRRMPGALAAVCRGVPRWQASCHSLGGWVCATARGSRHK